MKYNKLLFISLSILLTLLIYSCGDSEVNTNLCEDQTSGFDPTCGCPGEQVGFNGFCTNPEGLPNLVYYFAKVDFQCYVNDSIAIGIDINNATMYPAISNNVLDPDMRWHSEIGSQEYSGGEIFNSSMSGGCNDPDIPGAQVTYFRPNATKEEIDLLPDELEFHFIHKAEGTPADFIETIDSTTFVFVKDADRR